MSVTSGSSTPATMSTAAESSSKLSKGDLFLRFIGLNKQTTHQNFCASKSMQMSDYTNKDNLRKVFDPPKMNFDPAQIVMETPGTQMERGNAGGQFHLDESPPSYETSYACSSSESGSSVGCLSSLRNSFSGGLPITWIQPDYLQKIMPRQQHNHKSPYQESQIHKSANVSHNYPMLTNSNFQTNFNSNLIPPGMINNFSVHTEIPPTKHDSYLEEQKRMYQFYNNIHTQKQGINNNIQHTIMQSGENTQLEDLDLGSWEFVSNSDYVHQLSTSEYSCQNFIGEGLTSTVSISSTTSGAMGISSRGNLVDFATRGHQLYYSEHPDFSVYDSMHVMPNVIVKSSKLNPYAKEWTGKFEEKKLNPEAKEWIPNLPEDHHEKLGTNSVIENGSALLVKTDEELKNKLELSVRKPVFKPIGKLDFNIRKNIPEFEEISQEVSDTFDVVDGCLLKTTEDNFRKDLISVETKVETEPYLRHNNTENCSVIPSTEGDDLISSYQDNSASDNSCITSDIIVSNVPDIIPVIILENKIKMKCSPLTENKTAGSNRSADANCCFWSFDKSNDGDLASDSDSENNSDSDSENNSDSGTENDSDSDSDIVFDNECNDIDSNNQYLDSDSDITFGNDEYSNILQDDNDCCDSDIVFNEGDNCDSDCETELITYINNSSDSDPCCSIGLLITQSSPVEQISPCSFVNVCDLSDNDTEEDDGDDDIDWDCVSGASTGGNISEQDWEFGLGMNKFNSIRCQSKMLIYVEKERKNSLSISEKANLRWETEIDHNIVPSSRVRVHFNDDVRVEYADADIDRVSEWEIYARNSMRFRNKVEKLCTTLNPVLLNEHRHKIYEERFKEDISLV